MGMKLGTNTGSLINHVATSSRQIQPEIGMGATICYWSDREVGTIIKLTPCQIHIQMDKATRTDNNGMSECQQYVYERNLKGAIHIFRKTKRGWRNPGGNGIIIGHRDKYHDFSF